MLQRIKLISITSIALDKILRMSLFSRRGSVCSARGGVAAEGTSWGESEPKLENFQRPVSKMPTQALQMYLFFLLSQSPRIKKLPSSNVHGGQYDTRVLMPTIMGSENRKRNRISLHRTETREQCRR